MNLSQILLLNVEQSDMSLRVLELTKALNYLLSNGNEQRSHPQKNVFFQLLDKQHGMVPSELSFHPSQKYNSEPGQHFLGKPRWQARPHYQPIHQKNSQPPIPPGQPRFLPNNSVRPTMICVMPRNDLLGQRPIIGDSPEAHRIPAWERVQGAI